MAEGILIVPIKRRLEDSHRILALSIVRSVALPAKFIAGFCGEVLGCDDLHFIGCLCVLRTRSMATLTGYIHIFVIPVSDNRFVTRKVLRFDRNACGMTPSAISGQGIVGRGPIFR